MHARTGLQFAWSRCAIDLTAIFASLVIGLSLIGCEPSPKTVYERSPMPISMADIAHLEARYGPLDSRTRERVDAVLLKARRDWIRWRTARDRRFREIAVGAAGKPGSDLAVSLAFEQHARESADAFASLDAACLDRLGDAVAKSAWSAHSTAAIELLSSRRAMERPLVVIEGGGGRPLDVRDVVEDILAPLTPEAASTLARHEQLFAEHLETIADLQRRQWAARLRAREPRRANDEGRDFKEGQIEEAFRELLDKQHACVDEIASTCNPVGAASLRMAWLQAVVEQSTETVTIPTKSSLRTGITIDLAEPTDPTYPNAQTLASLMREADLDPSTVAAAVALIQERTQVLARIVEGQRSARSAGWSRSAQESRDLVLESFAAQLLELDAEVTRLVESIQSSDAERSSPRTRSQSSDVDAGWPTPKTPSQVFADEVGQIEQYLRSLSYERRLTIAPALIGVPEYHSLPEAMWELLQLESVRVDSDTMTLLEVAANTLREAVLVPIAANPDADPHRMSILELAVEEWPEVLVAISSFSDLGRSAPVSMLLLALSATPDEARLIAEVAARSRESRRDAIASFASLVDAGRENEPDTTRGLDSLPGVFMSLSNLDPRYSRLCDVESVASKHDMSADHVAAMMVSGVPRWSRSLEGVVAQRAARFDAAVASGRLPEAEANTLKKLESEFARLFSDSMTAIAKHAQVQADMLSGRCDRSEGQAQLNALAARLDDLTEAVSQAESRLEFMSLKSFERGPSTTGRADAVRLPDADASERLLATHRDARLALEAALPGRIAEIREFLAKNRFGHDLDEREGRFATSQLEDALFRASQNDPLAATGWDTWRDRVPALLAPMLFGERQEPSSVLSTRRADFDIEYADALLTYRDAIMRACREIAYRSRSNQVSGSLRRALLSVPFAGDGGNRVWE